jgi:ABC-2 type transport system permease protein
MAVNEPAKAVTPESPPSSEGPKAPDSDAFKTRSVIDGWALLGSALVAVLVVLVNYVSFRRYERWDLTRDRIFTLSERTDKLLAGLTQPVDVYVFMGASEPTYQELRELVTRYKAKSDKITAHFVDPDREPTKFRVLSEKFGVRAGVGENGEASAELAALLVSGEKRWVINRDDLLEVDFDSLEGEGRNLKVKSVKTEQALSGALVQVTSGRPTKVCLTEGHGEREFEEGTARGLLPMREELKRENIVSEALTTQGKAALPKECDAIFVLGPTKSFSADEAAALKRYLDAGGNLLLALDPVISGESLVSTGLEELAQAHGIGIDADVSVELDEQALLSPSPVEHFVVRNYGEHKIVRSLAQLHLPVVMTLARSLSLASGGEAVALLKTSDKAYGETGLAQLAAGDDLKAGEGDVKGPLMLGAVVDTKPPKQEGAASQGGGRLVVLGDSDWLDPAFLRQPQLANIDLLSGITGYLCEREALVAIAPRKVEGQAMLITEEGFASVFWRVVVLLPLSLLVLGVGVWLQRRQ